jgi:ADP-heptose:LPS heptosyltransferase
MNLDKIRWLDFHLGKLILRVLSLVNLPIKLMQNISRSAPKRILLIKFLGLGSLVMSYPAYKLTKNRFPNAKIDFLTFDNAGQILKLLKMGNKVYTIRTSSPFLFLIDFMKILPKIAFKYDVCVDLEFFARFSQMCAFFSFSKQKIGLYLNEIYRGSLLTNKINYNYHNHTSKTYLQLVNEIGIARKGGFDPEQAAIPAGAPVVLPKIKTGEENAIFNKLREKNSAITKNSKLFVINPNALISKLNVWPEQSYIKLVKRMLSRVHDSFAVFIGAKNEAAGIEKLLNKVNSPRCINFAGKTNLAELIALFNISAAFLSNDSGPAHMASLTNLRTVVLFGPDSPLINGPIGKNIQPITLNLPCSPCINAFNGKKSDCTNNICLKNIPTELVFEKLFGR